MKKNKGNKSNIKLAKEQTKNPRYWRDSSGNIKHFCLHCFKTFKHSGKCCEWPLMGISSQARPPKRTAGKSEWKRFISLFIHGTRSDNIGQLKKIISIRNEYGLNVLEQELRLKKLTEKKEEEYFGVFDIKRHEQLSVDTLGDKYEDQLKHINQICTKAHRDQTVKDFVHNTEYFLVPLCAGRWSNLIIPTKADYFKIYKARGYNSKLKFNDFSFRIKTDNINEVIESLHADSSRYTYRQSLMCFPTRAKAMAFRQTYLTALFPILKAEGIDYLDDIVDAVNLDLERVTKRNPELLI